jgi:predicted acyl esterase
MDGFRAAPPQVPLRVPTLLLQSEQENVLGPRAAPPARPRSPRTLHPARRSFKDLVARHVDAGFVVPRASTHSEFTDVGLPASLLGQRTAAHFLLAWMDEYVAGRDGTTRLHARTADATADASSIGIGTPKIAGIDVERLLSRLFPSDLGTCLDLRTTACPLPPRCRPRAVWTRVEGRVLVRLQRPCGRVQEVRVGRRRALIGTGDVVRLRASRGQRVRLVGGRVTHVRGRAAPAGGPESIDTSFTTSDGVVLHATLTGEAPITARPTVVEFTPYGVNTGTFDPGPEFNKLVVEDRGTGRSGGGFDALGPLAQRDVRETLEWACHQPWSNGTLGINGFSASAIVIYNALHLELPCVKAAVLKSGTFELYRDLLSPGGVSNIVPATVVFAGIGGGALAQGGYRDPATDLAAIAGMFASGTGVLQHPTLDDWWRERGFRGDVNNLPILMIGGFYDVESRGAFEAFQALKDDGAHLYVIGAHDQAPRGTDGGRAEMTSWFDRYLRGVRNGVAGHPRVQLWMSRGDRKTHVAGEYLHYGARDWPVPGTRWRRFALSPDKSGTARSINDGTLTPEAPPEVSAASYPATVSETTATDVPNAAIVDAAGFAALSDGFPTLTDMSVAEPLGLSFTSAAFEQDMLSAGPAALSLSLSSTAPTTAIWAVLSDVGPDGVAHPLTVGRLSTDYPNVDVARSRTDPVTGEIVQPYGDFSVRTPAVPGQVRRYQVEFWPLGNVFQAGHRLRLHLVGQSAASLPGVPAVNTVTLGGADPSRLLVPVTPAEKAAVRRRCAFTVRVRKRVRSAVVRIGGRRVARIRHGRHRVRVKLRGRRRGAVRVTVVMRLRDGRRVKRTRTYHPCARG